MPLIAPQSAAAPPGPPRGRFRLTLKSIMITVAVLALAFGCLGVVGGPLAVLAGGLVAWPMQATDPRVKAARTGWVVALQPILANVALYATWLAAWGSTGQVPTPPVGIGLPLVIPNSPSSPSSPTVAGGLVVTLVAAIPTPITFFACLYLAMGSAKRRQKSAPNVWVQFGPPLLRPATWFAGVAFWVADPFGAVRWFGR